MSRWATNKHTGFTIVELLIVIVVIAILAAITIVAYNGIQSQAVESSVKADMQNVGKKLELLRVDLGTWPNQSDAGLEPAKINVSKSLYTTTENNFLYCGSTTSSDYALAATATNGKTYAYGSSRVFGEYTTYPISNYSSACSNLIGSGSARYGFTLTDNWRLWTRNPS